MAINQTAQPLSGPAAPPQKARTSFGILGAISLSHLLNDMIQSLILAIYPLLQAEFSLTFVQIGMITLTFQLTSSLFQPVIGYITDKRSMPWSLPVGMCFTLCGLILLALAGSFGMVLLAAALVGTGSSVFHPESSRVARMASGGRHGLAQSLFQVGGNFGSSLGPLLAAVIIAPYGKGNVAWFVLAALLAIVVLSQISRWYAAQHRMNKGKPKPAIVNPLPRKKVILAAADTFRAAAIEQLTEWAGRAGVDLIAQQEGSDPAAVIYDAIAAAKSRNADVLICDTAGRLHNKKNLMEELKKINRIIDKEYPDAYRETLVVLDGTTGQNALAQAKQFMEVADITGIILTKLDGTAKGGIAVAIQSELGIPVKYVGIGEKIDDLQKFDANDFVNALFKRNEALTENE